MGRNLADWDFDLLRYKRTCLVFDDFFYYTSAQNLWTSVLAGSASSAVGDGEGGLLTVSAIDSVTNREAYVKLTNQPFLITANNPLCAEAYIQYTEANTNKANMAFGFMSGVTTASIADTTGEPKASFSGAVIYKVPGGTVWKTCSSVGTTQNTNTSTTTAGTASAYTRLRIEINPVSATIAEVQYFVDGVQLQKSGGRPGTSLIKDSLTYTGAIAMGLFVCCKNGSTTPEVLKVDYMGAVQLRAIF